MSVENASSEQITAKKTVKITILVNNKPVQLHEHEVTGRQIKTAANIPLEFKLYGPHGDEIGNDEVVKIHEREKFTAISGQDVS